MDKATFYQHLETATQMVINFTRQYCVNELPSAYLYFITPNARTVDLGDEHLTEKERTILQEWNQYEDVPLMADRVVELLHRDGKVPVWIDVTVTATTPNHTFFQLLCSRRIREDKDLMHQPVVPPFHIQVALPPDYQERVLFDVNWKKHWFARNQQKS